MPRILSLLLAIFSISLVLLLAPAASPTPSPKKKIAAIVTAYYQNSHADVIVSRLFQTMTLDGLGDPAKLDLVSLYTDQIPATDISRKLAAEYHFPIYDSVEQALTLGTGTLAVDGVLLVAEHGNYPRSETTSIQYPKRRLLDEIIKVFKASGRVVPIFIDKHLADNWTDARYIYDTAKEMHIPLMAGSSLPVLWRFPPADVKPGAELQQVVAVSYHTLDAYGFHALEMVECLIERRQGGETGVKSVQCLEGNAVWEAGDSGVYDKALLDAALSRLKNPPRPGKTLQELAKTPTLFVIDYADGLRANVLTLNGALGEWSVAWRYKADNVVESTLFWTQEKRPFMHFAYLYQGIEQMMLSGKPSWPVERTLLTSGTLDALLISKKDGGKKLDTPYLTFAYKTDWSWQQPPVPEDESKGK